MKHRNDDGATLIIVLFIITVVALVIGALATSVDTSQRTTIGLRTVTTNTYAADGAGQVAVNAMQKSGWKNDVGSHCFTSGLDDIVLSNISGTTSADVHCVAETGTGAQGAPVPINSANKPGNAVLTLGVSPNESGQTYGQSNKTVTIHGGVVSDSNIDATSAGNPGLNITGGALVRAATGCTGTVTAPPLNCTTGLGVLDPNYPAPDKSLVVTAPPSSPTPTNCKNKKQAEFYPGLYTSADALNTCDGNGAYMHLNPGTYFFDFTTGSHVWTVNTEVVAGTLTAPLTGPGDVPGACANPIADINAVGVTLVFGGDSQLALAKGSAFEACATYSATSIPTVVYGLKSNLTNGALTAHAESGCTIAIHNVPVNSCDVISDGGNGTKPTFYFEGFVYTAPGSINLAVNNYTRPFFNFGLIARTLTLSTTGSASTLAYINLPDNSPGFGLKDTIADLTVYVCPGKTTCASSGANVGRVKLVARVDLGDPTVTPRQVTLISWNLLP